MENARGVLIIAYLLLAWCPSAFALNPALDVNQYAHTSWQMLDGFPKGQITSFAQTPDGYLWLGTEFGLIRFDGIKKVVWTPPANQQLPSSFIFSLLVGRDGTLWIGTAKGLASWKDGKLTQYAELAERYIFKLLEDRGGSIWASGLAVSAGKLCAIRNGGVQCFGDDGSLGRGAFNLYEDSKGNLWAGVKDGCGDGNLEHQNSIPSQASPTASSVLVKIQTARCSSGGIAAFTGSLTARLCRIQFREGPSKSEPEECFVTVTVVYGLARSIKGWSTYARAEPMYMDCQTAYQASLVTDFLRIAKGIFG
jgi:ligand-binding sensor domain-containing protein